MVRAASIVVLLGLSACATPYQDMGFLGGVQATQIASDTFQITARGNAYTDADTIQLYAMRKAAEATLSAGYDMFSIRGDQDRSTQGSQTFGGASGNRYSVWGSSTTWQMVKPGQTLWVKASRYPKPDPMPDGLYDARDVLRFLAPPTSDSKPCTNVGGVVKCE